MAEKTALVVSAHSADFVWRCGGAIALHQEKGVDVTIVCLSFGERGESAKLWKLDGMTLDKVKSERKREAENAAKTLGAHDIRFFDVGDYPLDLGRDATLRMTDVMREVQPEFILTHSRWDPYNTDHMDTFRYTIDARMIAQAHGHNPGEKILGAPQVYLFEPHQTEQMEWKPDVFLDISSVWEKKWAAIQCIGGAGAPLAFLQERRGKPGQSFPAQFRRHGVRAKVDPCGRLPVDLPAHRG